MKVRTKKRSFEAKGFGGLSVYMGLRFRRPQPALLFANGKRVDIDMFFCFWPMEVFWIRDKKVMKKVLAKPFRIYFGVDADFVLETPVGFSGLKEGDVVECSP
jgi:uncharacterized membrane protein (UPF0127 family)